MAGNENKSLAQDTAQESKQVTSEGSAFMAPPAFQLTAGDGGVVQRQEAATLTTTVDIQASVGAGTAVNHASDVIQVQSRLQELGILVAREVRDFSQLQPNAVVPADQMQSIIRAITYFQRGVMASPSPDGKVDPGGATETRLNSSATTATQNQQSVAGFANHDTLDPTSIRIIQNVLGGTVDGDLLQNQSTAGAWAMNNETDSQTRIQNFQTAPTGYDGQAIANAPANGDRSGWIEEGTVSQVFGILVGANQHGYALHLVIDYYDDYTDAPNAANPLRLSLGTSLEVYYDASLTQNFRAFEEMGGLRTIAVGPGAFTSAAQLRTCIAQAQTAPLQQPATGMTNAATQVVDQTLVTDQMRGTIDTGITQAVSDAAISYNSGFFNQAHSVRIIQAAVGAPVTGTFDGDTIRFITYFQSANNAGQQGQQNPATVGTNGQLDPKTVDLLGRDLIARQEFNSVIQLAMDYYNINITDIRAMDFGDPTARNDNMQQVRGSNITSIVYDPTLAGEFATDADLNATNANERIRDIRGIGAIRIGQAAFASFTSLVSAISKGISDVSRPGDGQLATEGTNRGLIPPLADMSTFQVPYSGAWTNNGASGWLGATMGGRNGGHGGWDIYAPIGTPIRACTDGVADTTTQNGYGSVVRLLANGRVYFYAHLSGFAIPTTGQTNVVQGQVLGYVGVAGNAAVQRPHLHFEVRSGNAITAGTRVDPDDYFTRPTKQRFYSSRHQDMITTEIPNDTEFPYPGVEQETQDNDQD